jgi:hypothetical protein
MSNVEIADGFRLVCHSLLRLMPKESARWRLARDRSAIKPANDQCPG